MNQQEFIPESQDNEKPNTQSYSQYRTSDMPKRDHPADYSGSISAYSYQAQDTTDTRQQQSQAQQTSNTKQRPQGSARQQAGAQHQPFSASADRMKERFYQQRQNFFQDQNRSGQSSAPPYMGTRPQGKPTPNLLPMLMVIALVLLILPIVLKLLFVLVVALFVMGTFLLILVVSLILIYRFYLKRRWQRSRWWFW